MESYEKWPLVLEEKELKIELRRNPDDSKEYALHKFESEHYLFLNKGTLEVIAESSILHGREVMKNFVKEFQVSEDALVAIITRACFLEERSGKSSSFRNHYIG